MIYEKTTYPKIGPLKVYARDHTFSVIQCTMPVKLFTVGPDVSAFKCLPQMISFQDCPLHHFGLDFKGHIFDRAGGFTNSLMAGANFSEVGGSMPSSTSVVGRPIFL